MFLKNFLEFLKYQDSDAKINSNCFSVEAASRGVGFFSLEF